MPKEQTDKVLVRQWLIKNGHKAGEVTKALAGRNAVDGYLAAKGKTRKDVGARDANDGEAVGR